MASHSPAALSFALAVTAAVFAAPARAEIPERIQLRSSTVEVLSKKDLEVLGDCLGDERLLSATITPVNLRGIVTRSVQPVVNGQLVLVDGVHGAATGVQVTLYNTLDVADVATVEVLCAVAKPEYGSRTVAGTVQIAGRSTDRAVTQCGAGYVATWGGFRAPSLAVRSYYPHLSTAPYYLDQVPDGTYSGPVGYEAYATNPGDSAQPLTVFAVCWPLPEASTQVGSVALAAGELRFVGQAVPDQQFIVGGGVAGGSEGFLRGGARWTLGAGVNYTRAGLQYRRATDRPVPSSAGAAMTPKVGEANGRSGGVLGSFVQDLRPAGSMAPATPVKTAVVTLPTAGAAPAVNVVQVVEYYNAVRDHWFVTAIPQEIGDLDAGVHPGWVRTGQSFKAYGIGSGGPVGRLPFCRYYGLPERGLDSHFYTGSILECLEVIAKFRGAWQLESGEVFQVQLPNVQTGACPAGTLAVFRTWNGRADSNHRYTADPATRTQMVAAGHVAEGYGPMGVAFCAPA